MNSLIWFFIGCIIGFIGAVIVFRIMVGNLKDDINL